MPMHRFGFVLSTLLLGAFAVSIGGHPAAALQKLNEAGSFSCGCSGGTGTCDFEASDTNGLQCYKGPSDTCTATCKLTITPDKLGIAPAARGTIRRGGNVGTFQGN